MGMDVKGLKPTTKVGKHFRNSVWWWHPLWNYILYVAPWVSGKVSLGHVNDGDGLKTQADCDRLAKALEAEIEVGACGEYGESRQSVLDAMPDEPCNICGGTGYRLPPPTCGPGEQPCNGCDSTGKIRPFETHYPFDVDNAKKFVEFLKGCGGFAIW